MVRNLRFQTGWILESNCRENAAELRRIRSNDIPLYQCLGERRIKKQRRGKTSIHFNGKYAKHRAAFCKSASEDSDSSGTHYAKRNIKDETVTPRAKQCLKMPDAHLAETRQSLRPIRPEHQRRQRNDEQSEGAEYFDWLIRSENWMAALTESHGESRRQRLHLQLRSGQLHNGKRVGTHGNLDHLRNGGGFCFLEGIPENRREGVDRTPTHETHLCSTVFSQARNDHTTRLAQVTRITFRRCAPEKNLSSGCCTCLILVGRCVTRRLPRANHLPHSLFLLPRHKNSKHNR